MKIQMVVAAVHCAAALCAANVAFAPNIQPMPTSITVESNTLVRLNRDQTVSIACAACPDAAAAWGAPYGDSPLWKWGYDLDLIRNLRDVEHDMRLENIEDTGTYTD